MRRLASHFAAGRAVRRIARMLWAERVAGNTAPSTVTMAASLASWCSEQRSRRADEEARRAARAMAVD